MAAGDAGTARAGAQVLAAGGSAVDAALAAVAASWVCELPLSSPGGGGLLTARTPEGGWAVLDFFSTVPGLGLGQRPSLDFGPISVDFGPDAQQFHVGRGAVAVPASLHGFVEAHARCGRLPLSEVVAPAVRMGREGVEISAPMAWIFEILAPIVHTSASVRALFSDGDHVALAGDHIHNPGLADLLEAVAVEGRAFLDGPWAEACLAAAGPDQGGLLTAEDLRRYQTVWREPLVAEVGAHQVLLPPPPAAGGPLVALGVEGSSALAGLDLLAPDGVSAMAHLLRAQSDAHLGSPLGSTTHVSVLTEDGDAASITTSNGEGCGHALPAWGTHLNNFLGEEDINPGGFHQTPSGTRMSTMMTPTVVLREGRPELVLGTGGSSRIRSALTQVISRVLVAKERLQEAVDAPRLHVEGPQLWLEQEGLPEASTTRLRAEWPGAIPFDTRSLFFGGVNAVAVEEGGLVGVGDSRRHGAVACS